MAICPWTGEAFPYKKNKRFVSEAARREYHTAARMYVEKQIDDGAFNMKWLKEWYEANRPPCTPHQTPDLTKQAAE